MRFIGYILATLALSPVCLRAAETATSTEEFHEYSQTPRTQFPFQQTAIECGESIQNHECSIQRGGKTMCGRSVAQMIKCMSNVTNSSRTCDAQDGARCGNGQDFVSCNNGAMKRCGYVKIEIPDKCKLANRCYTQKGANCTLPGPEVGCNFPKECRLPGAVLAYSHTYTSRGSIYGHVEFVCGADAQGVGNKFCSIYKGGPRNEPWPAPVPNACWYPDSGPQIVRPGGGV